jgi:hypothetical protein
MSAMEPTQSGVLVGGALTAAMAAFHARFHALFGWREDLAKLHLRNRRILWSVHVALVLLFAALAALSFEYSAELARAEGLAMGVDVALALFWLWRTIWQMAYFEYPKEYHAHTPVIHWVLCAVFAALAASYALPVVSRLTA